MFNISNLIIPLLVLLIILYGIIKKINVYDAFIEGSRESFPMIISMFPCLLAMILSINILVNSGILDIFEKLFKNYADIIPLALMRPISGTASLAMLNDLFNTYSPDSFIGRLGSVIQGSTETTFYVLTLYFGSVGIKKIRYAMTVGLLADLVGIIASVFLVKLLF